MVFHSVGVAEKGARREGKDRSGAERCCYGGRCGCYGCYFITCVGRDDVAVDEQPAEHPVQGATDGQRRGNTAAERPSC